jgi:hypothetical protein
MVRPLRGLTDNSLRNSDLAEQRWLRPGVMSKHLVINPCGCSFELPRARA